MQPTITTVIATRNDPLLLPTIESLRRNYDGRVIVVDDSDAGDVFVDRAEIIHNRRRLGPGPSRQLGASLVASNDWILFCDSHMDFPPDWHKRAIDHLKSSDVSEIWGAVYRQHKIDNPFWHETRLVGGADFYLWRHNDIQFSFADLKPRRIINSLIYSVPCLLGGCYFIHSSWFRKLGGFSNLIGYGSEETWFSMLTWMNGGHVRIMGNLFVTHIYTKPKISGPRSPLPEAQTNHLAVMRRILSKNEYEEFCSWLPMDPMVKDEVERRCPAKPSSDVLSYMEVAQTFGLQTFQEAMELMQVYFHHSEETCVACKNRRWLIAFPRLVACPRCNKDESVQPKIGMFELLPIL